MPPKRSKKSAAKPAGAAKPAAGAMPKSPAAAPERKPKGNRSQPLTLAKYHEMLRNHSAWSQRNILGVRSFLRKDLLQEPGRWDLLQDFLKAANKGLPVEKEAHQWAVDYIKAKSRDGIGRVREGSRFSEDQLRVIEAAVEHRVVGLLPNPRHPDRWLAVYEAKGPLGSVIYVGAKYERIKVLGSKAPDPPAQTEKTVADRLLLLNTPKPSPKKSKRA